MYHIIRDSLKTLNTQEVHNRMEYETYKVNKVQLISCLLVTFLLPSLVRDSSHLQLVTDTTRVRVWIISNDVCLYLMSSLS